MIYAFALYNDFAGYTNIVRGVSGLFGIELSANFQTPYFSRNFTEFWKRWHITLSEWLRDYIYFPISRVLETG
jgi:alginate O-acetyltransferase complex protein AlgI